MSLAPNINVQNFYVKYNPPMLALSYNLDKNKEN